MGALVPGIADGPQDAALRAKDGIDRAGCHAGPLSDDFDGGADVALLQE